MKRIRYVVDRIISNAFEPDVRTPASCGKWRYILTRVKGTIRYEVKWLGYEKKSDRTWEPEENL